MQKREKWKKRILKRRKHNFSLGLEPSCTLRRFKFQTDLKPFKVQVCFVLSKKGSFLVQRSGGGGGQGNLKAYKILKYLLGYQKALSESI